MSAERAGSELSGGPRRVPRRPSDAEGTGKVRYGGRDGDPTVWYVLPRSGPQPTWLGLHGRPATSTSSITIEAPRSWPRAKVSSGSRSRPGHHPHTRTLHSMPTLAPSPHRVLDTAELYRLVEQPRLPIPVRIFDLVVSALALIILAPLLGLIAAVVKLSSPGPVLYRSERLCAGPAGVAGATFGAWKFRSMYAGADDRLVGILHGDARAAAQFEQHQKLAADPRVTPVGRIIRRYSLDELPQLVNILRGEMSVVGPRPKPPEEREIFGPHLPTVLSVRPGLTGLWQVSGRNRLSMGQRVALDVHYVEHRTLAADLAICGRTFIQLWKPEKHGAW